MAEVQFKAVLEFFRKHKLSECESALMEDVTYKSQLGSSDLKKYFFPMVPPPPPLRIPSTRLLPPPQELSVNGGGSSDGSSDDEFVSLGSSTTELCSSEFTNPYGIRTTRATSQASSERLSQFGTARDYPDFDMQNDLFWYKEKDEDYVMPPLFGGRDFDDVPIEDKYVTTVQTGECMEDRVAYKYFESRWGENLENEAYKDYYDLYSTGDPIEYKLGNLKVTNDKELSDTGFSVKGDSTYDLDGGFGNTDDFHTVKEDSQPEENEKYGFILYDELKGGESHEPKVAVDDEGGTISNELQIYETKEDDYEIFNLRIIHRKNRTGFEENKDFPIVINGIIAGRYYVTEFLGAAAFSKVVQAHDLYSGMDVCLKIIKNEKDFFDQSLDEIKLLKYVNKHDPFDERHILRLYDYFYYQEHLFIVTELLKANLYEFQKYNRESGGEPYFTLPRLQVITRQCLEALSYLHDLGIVHCDLKPENILLKNYRRCEIKVIDLGRSCFQTDNLVSYVQSRSYRAPEVMLGLPYDHKIDLWSLGCILAELYSGELLFPNEAIATLLARMISMLSPIDMDMLQKGQETPKYFTKEYDLYYINEDTKQVEYIVPKKSSLEQRLQIFDSRFIDFLNYLLKINPKRRPSARDALRHPWLSHSYDQINSY